MAWPLLFLGCALLPVNSLATPPPDWVKIKELLNTKQTPIAKTLLDNILASKPDNQLAKLLLAHAYIEENNTEAAVNIYQHLAKQKNPALPVINNLAVLYARQGKLADAILILQQGIKNDLRFSILSENINRIYSQQASNAYKKALSKPNKPTLQSAKPLDLVLMTVDPSQYLKAPQTKQREYKPADDTQIKTDVIRTIHSWAETWSSKNVTHYLAFYHQDFQLPHNVSRKSWNAFRKKRLQTPKSISVTIANPLLLFASDNELAVVEFTQNYRSNTFRETRQKLLILRKTGNEWKIIREYLSN